MKLQNPNINKEPGAVRDPMIVLVDDKYYMVATSPEFWEGYSPGVKLWSSDDLIDWKFECLAVASDDISDNDWCKERFWAPELFVYRGRYYITFSSKNEKLKKPFAMFMAVADCVTGPYTLVSREPVMQGGIDAHLFQDDDGQVYFFYGFKNIHMARFDMENFCPLEEARTIVSHGLEGEWDSIGIEGPALVKRDGKYYLWYSSWTRGYEMGWATADNLSGPFTKWSQNPVISGKCERFDCAGHNCVFRLKDGRDAIAYHAHKLGEEERLCIDLVTYPMESRTPVMEIIV